MRSEYPVPFGWEHQLREYEKRLLDLERRSSATAAMPSVPKVLNDLDDVEVLYDSLDVGVPPVDGDVLTYDADRELWVPAEPAAGSGVGGWASISYTGLYDGSATSAEETEWNLASAPGYALGTVTGGALLGTLQEGIDVTAPGIYQVHASVAATMSGGPGTPAVSILHTAATAGWTLDGDAETCHAPIHATDTGTDAAGVSLLLPLEPDTPVAIDVDMGGCTEVRWRIQVALVHDAAVLTGTCGG